MDGLSLLKKYCVFPTKVETPIMKKNVDGMDIKEFCDKNSFEFFASPTIFNKNDGNSEPQNFCLLMI